LRLGH